jgi:hypothetical protein
MAFSMEGFFARADALHAEQVAQGLHDAECEWDKNHRLCHCSKRRREAEGFTTPPDEDLYFPPPDCPHCAGDLEFDGDGFSCYKCRLSWDSRGSGSSARFTDDYGDLSRCEEHGIRGHVICQPRGK